MCLRKQRNGGGGGGRLETSRVNSRKRVAITRHLTLSLTGEASAVAEAQYLHAFGEDECTDITCEGRKKREVCEDERRERVRLRTDKEKRVHSQTQSVKFTTATPTPLASPVRRG